MEKIRESARWIIIKDNLSVILIHRIKKWSEYWVTPGGWIEEWEDKKTAFKRELKEEVWDITISGTKLIKIVRTKVDDTLNIQYIYQCDYVWWEIWTWDWPEFTIRNSAENYYNLEVINKKSLEELNIVPEEIKDIIMDILIQWRQMPEINE